MPKREPSEFKDTLATVGLLDSEVPESFLAMVLGGREHVERLLDTGELRLGSKAGWVKPVPAENTRQAADRLSPSEKYQRFRLLAVAAAELRLEDSRIAAFNHAAHDYGEARRYWIRAAEKACADRRYPAALDFLKKCLSIWPWNENPVDRVRILRELARCAQNTGDPETSHDTWKELADYGQESGRIDLQVEALRQLAGFMEDAARATEVLREAAELAEKKLPPESAVRPMLAYLDNLASRIRLHKSRELLERIVNLVEQTRSPALHSEVLGWQGLIAAMSGDHGAAESFIEKSLRKAINHDLPFEVALAYRRQANIAEYRSNYSGEIAAHRAAIRYCQEADTGDQMSCFSCLAYACFRAGEWKEALESATTVLRDPEAHPALRSMAETVEGLIAAFRGERKAAENLLRNSLRRLQVDGLLGMEFFALLGLAWLRQLDEDPDGATRLYDEIRTLWRESEDVHDVIPAILFAGGHYASVGLDDRITDCLDILGSIRNRNPVPEAQAALLALKAEQAHLGGDSEGFSRGMQEAAGIFHDAGLVLEFAWTGISAATAGCRDDLITQSISAAKRLGLRPFLAAIENQSGKQTRPSDLTPRQLEVLQFLSEGLTSKEIADRLSLSTRTVEMHVSRLLQRLNCRTRSEAVHMASERGWI